MGVIGELTDAHANDEFEVGFGPVGIPILKAKSNAMFTIVISYTYHGKIVTEHLIVTADFKQNDDSIRDGKIRNIRGIYKLSENMLSDILLSNKWPKTNVPHATTTQEVLNWYSKLQ